jgi:hypothetical protein
MCCTPKTRLARAYQVYATISKPHCTILEFKWNWASVEVWMAVQPSQPSQQRPPPRLVVNNWNADHELTDALLSIIPTAWEGLHPWLPGHAGKIDRNLLPSPSQPHIRRSTSTHPSKKTIWSQPTSIHLPAVSRSTFLDLSLSSAHLCIYSFAFEPFAEQTIFSSRLGSWKS